MKPGRWRALATVILVVGSLFPAFLPAPAGAVTDINGGGVFQLDGDIQTNPPPSQPAGVDWDALFTAAGTPIPDGKAWVSATMAQDWNEPDNTYFVPAKDSDAIGGVGQDWQCQTAPENLTPKDNIMNAYAAAFNSPAPNDGNKMHQLLYLGFERLPGSTGDAMAGFWFFQNPVGCTLGSGQKSAYFTGSKTEGDILILANFSNGGRVVDIEVYDWRPSLDPKNPLHFDVKSSNYCPDITTGPIDICGVSNTGSITPPWPDSPSGTAVALTSEDFFEIGIDVTAYFGKTFCSNSFMGETRSSTSLSATLKDYTMGSLNVCRDTTTSTQLSKSSLTSGQTVHDTATIGGTPGPTGNASGTMTFNVYHDAANCTANASTGDPLATYTLNVVDGVVQGQTPEWSPPGPGTYQWQAIYSGDAANKSSKSACGAEPVSVKVDSTTETQPSTSSITLGQSLTDKATVTGMTGGPTPTGSVNFYVCADTSTGCSTGGTKVGATKSLSGTGVAVSVTSDSYTPDHAGSFCFRAEYLGDTNYVGSSDGSKTECFTVGKAGSTTVTTPSTNDAQFGDLVTDSAKVTGVAGGVAPTGTVTFYICGPFLTAVSNCGTATPTQVGTPVNLSTGTVSGSAPAAISVTVESEGQAPLESHREYCFKAVYSGDGNYGPSTDNNDTECFGVDLAPSSTLTTAQSENTSATLGGRIRDMAVVTGWDGAAPGGTVTFTVCGPVSGSNCPNSQALTSGTLTKTSTGTTLPYESTAYSGWFTPPAAGTYCFSANYDGDTHYSGSSDSYTKHTAECIAVGKAPTTSATTPASASITLGGSNSDTLTVTGVKGGPAPTGTATFFICGPTKTAQDCTAGTSVAVASQLTAGADDPSGNPTSVATSAAYTPDRTGYWCFRAVYDPGSDPNYTGSSDGSALRECFKVDPAGSTTVTTPSTHDAAYGAAVTDSALVTGVAGGVRPTGTVTFFLCGPFASNTSDCGTSTPVQVGPAPVNLNTGTTEGTPPAALSVTVNSASVTPNEPYKTYCFKAVYSGDDNYKSSYDSNTTECFSVGKASSTTTTTAEAQSAPATLGGAIRDKAVVSGDNGAIGGSVSFTVCGPLSGSNCPNSQSLTGGTLSDTTPQGGPSQATAYSDWFTPPAAGTYCFSGTYSGDQHYTGSSDSYTQHTAECIAVGKAPTTSVTTPATASITLGASNSDTLTVTGVKGGPAPTGTVSFFICGPDDSPQDCATGTSVPVAAQLSAGGNDGNGNPTAVATSASYTPNSAGYWCFRAAYDPGSDPNYTGSSDGTAPRECFLVNPADSSTVTTPSTYGAAYGVPVTDSATVTGVAGGVRPTGTVTFYLCGPFDSATKDCGTSTPVQVGTAPVNLNTGKNVGTPPAALSVTVQSAGVTPNEPYMTYCFKAVYSGDGNYKGSHDSDTTECFSVGKASSTVTSVPDPKSGLFGQVVTDTATVTGSDGIPGGSVDFFICGPTASNCETGGSKIGSADLTGGTTGDGTSSASASFGYTASVPGAYCFRAVYLGDNHYAGNSDGSAGECFSVGKLDSAIKTTPQSANFAIGGSNTDTAVVSSAVEGGPTPQGNVKFFVCGPSATKCEAGGTELFTGSGETRTSLIPLSETGQATSPSFTPSASGTYCFRGEYQGSDIYNSSADGSATECFTVYTPYNPPNPTPTITTTPNPKTGVVGTAMADTANLTGGNGNPTGTISFYLYGPGDTTCSTDLVANTAGFKGITVSNRSATSPAYAATKTGVYQWVASYSGDGSNGGTRGNCADTTEQVVIGTAPTKITTTPNPSPSTPVTVGTAIKDTANVTGTAGPTGTVTFHLYGPGDTTCSTDLLSGNTAFANIPLSGGSATSPFYTTTKVGLYQWVATYSGDGQNQPSAGVCGDPTEQVTTGAVLAEIVTGANDLAVAVLGVPLLAAGLALLLLAARRREQHG